MLTKSTELFKVAQEKKFAFPAANFVDQLSAQAHIRTAEKMNLPLILAFAQVHQQFIPVDDAFAIGKYYAESAKVPVVLHLDHGTDKDLIFKAVDYGFTSVMIDASSDPIEENIRKTKEIVEYAHAHGVTVEAEIGHVGEGSEYVNAQDSNNIYTTVEEAKYFTEQTKVDSLAISIGTAHGAYKGTPKINFGRLNEIASAVKTPLVLHGGSSSGDENLNKCATNGICKINIFTDFILNGYAEMKESGAGDYFAVRNALQRGMMNTLERYYNVFETTKYLG